LILRWESSLTAEVLKKKKEVNSTILIRRHKCLDLILAHQTLDAVKAMNILVTGLN
jgi:hypothetical protein